MHEIPPRLSGALADRYVIERELGQGGMATVYLAHDVRHDRRVALKVLRPELSAILGADRFLAEIKTTANLQHPHILSLFDSGEADGLVFYVMPYVEGESLRDRLLREKQLPVEEAVRIAREVADALAYAHGHGVIHRDIKPENILLHGGHAQVADFGIALAVSRSDGGTRMTETGMSLGTPHYMSPEQAMGEREITAKSDVYALGCVTYEMLTGEPPFTGPTAQAIIARVMTEEPRSLTLQRKTIPPYVEAAVNGALAKLPADRLESAQAFAEALSGKTVATVKTVRAVPVAGRRLAPTVATAVLGLAALALWGWLRPARVPATSRQRVVLWHHALEQLLAPGAERVATQAAIAPDGSSIVFSDSTSDGIQLMRKLRNATDPAPLAGTLGGVSPFFSPDGRWIGYITVDGKLRKVPVDGGGSITLAPDANAVYNSAAWLDDGTIIFTGARNDVRRTSSDGGASRPVPADTSRRALTTPLMSPLPGSRGFLYTSCPGNCGIESAVYVFDLAADSGRLLVPNAAGAWYSPTGHLLYTDRAGGLYAATFDPKRLRLTSGAVPVIDSVVPASFTLSPSGSVLYSVEAGSRAASELMWVARDGSATPVDSSWRGDFDYPAVSPDGKALAVSLRDGSTQLWIRRSDGTRQKLTQSGSVNWRPAWTPDGQSVAYVSNVRGGGSQDDFDVYEMRVDLSAPAKLLLHHTYGLWEAEFSRKGEWLVVRSDEAGGQSNIRGRRLTGDTTLAPLVVGKGRLTTQVAISPDGHWLAYVSDATGRREVYVTQFPTPTSTRLISRDGGTEPRWAHSGRELFYKSGNQLMAVEVTPGPTLVAGVPRALFSIAGYRAARNRQEYDVAPDDRHFLMIKSLASDAPGEAVYVENWFQELKEKVKQ